MPDNTLYQIPVSVLEFRDGGTTIWVHGPDGATVLRIKATKIVARRSCENICAHADITVRGDIEVCIPEADLYAVMLTWMRTKSKKLGVKINVTRQTAKMAVLGAGYRAKPKQKKRIAP